jgi:hypothetical protein
MGGEWHLQMARGIGSSGGGLSGVHERQQRVFVRHEGSDLGWEWRIRSPRQPDNPATRARGQGKAPNAEKHSCFGSCLGDIRDRHIDDVLTE